MFKRNILKNGLRVISVPMKEAKSIVVLVLVGTGSKYETKEINGISHFLEHMFFKGTLKRPNTLKISETLDKIGGEYNAFTSKEFTGFWARVSKEYLEIALDWVSDILLNSKFEEEEVQKEKGVVIEELNMYLDTPTAYVSELFEKLLYGDQPAGWPIIGEKESILSINREKLLEYFKNHYSAGNTIVCVAGPIETEKIEKRVAFYFQKLEKKKPSSKSLTQEKQAKPEALVFSKKTDQTHFCLGVRAFDIFDERRYPLALISVILGGNMSSRLFISVREKHALAYYIHTLFEATTDTGYLVTQAGVKNDALEKAIHLILKEYDNLRKKGVTSQELKKAKDYMRGKFSLSLESVSAQASFYANQEIINKKILTPEEELKMIEKVSINDIKKVAKEIFQPQKLNFAVIGPIEPKDKKEIEKLLEKNF